MNQLVLENRKTQAFKYTKKSAANVLSAIRQFLYFTTYFKLSAIPASERTIICFLEFMARTVGYPHLKHLLSSVSYLHTALDFPFPTENFQVRVTMQGLKRRLAKVPFQVLPITSKMLREMFKHIDVNNTRDLALWCAFLCAFYGLLRKASAVPENVNSDEKGYLLRRHIKVDSENDILYLYLGYGKTNNFCTRDVIIPIPGNSDPALDPVRHVKKLFLEVEASPDRPAFSFSRQSFISYSTFSTRLKQLLKKAGYSPELYSGHSFRRGGATFLHNCGGTVLMIQASGDWSSQCFTRYLFLTEAQRLQAQLLMRNVING